MKLGKNKYDVKKEPLRTALVFTTVTGISLYCLYRWHEKEMDKLELDTAEFCIEQLTEQHENEIRRKRKEAAREGEEFRSELASAVNELINEYLAKYV